MRSSLPVILFAAALPAAYERDACAAPQPQDSPGFRELYRQARQAYYNADHDLNWLMQTVGEDGHTREAALVGEVRRIKRDLACARLRWREYDHPSASEPETPCGYASKAGDEPTVKQLEEVLGFFERARRQFFAKRDRTAWDTLLFFETRSLLARLKGDRLLRRADAACLAELQAAQAAKDLGRAIQALYNLRRFDEVLQLARCLGDVADMPAEKKAAVLRAVRGSLVFTGKKEDALSGAIASALRRLGNKGEETGRLILHRPGFFIGRRADLARVATILGTVETGWPLLAGRSRALLEYVAASCAFAAGDSEFALPLLRKARAARLGGYLGALIEGTAGACMENVGNYGEAVSAFTRARTLARELGNGAYGIRQTVNLVSALSALNLYVEAEEFLSATLKQVTEPREELWIRLLLGNTKYARARARGATGTLSPRAKRYLRDAEFIYDRCLERLTALPAFTEKEYLTALLWINLGNVKRRYALDDQAPEVRSTLLREALACAQRGLETAQKTKQDRLAVIAGANRAEVALELGDLDGATDFAEWALKAAKIMNYFEAAWRAEMYLGRIAEQKADLVQAVKHHEAAVEIVETYRRQLADEAKRASFLHDKVEAYQCLVRALLASGKAEEAFTTAERAKARTALESLGLKELLRSLGDENEAVVELVKVLRRIGSTRFPRATPFARAAKPVSLQRVSEELKALRGTLGKRLSAKPALTFLFGDSPSAAAIQGTLGKDETLVEYFPIGERLAAWVITRDGVKAVHLPGSWHEIARTVATFVEGKVEDEALAEKLGTVLLAPFAKLPPRLVIVPTGILHRLPFEALRFRGSYLLEAAETRYTPSAVMNVLLARNRSVKPGERKPFFALANPYTDYDGDGVPEKPDLAHAAQEVAAITKHYPGGETARGRRATEALWRRRAPAAGFIHLACHGVFHGHDPWQSSLFLAKGGGQDGTLEAWEVMALDLTGAELITLSGCETGVSSIKPGDDVVGLPRGFLLAGARSIVASLWPVEDQATAYLMTEFYRRMAQGEARAGALREAKRAVSRHPTFGSTRNWAAFVLFGRSGESSVNIPEHSRVLLERRGCDTMTSYVQAPRPKEVEEFCLVQEPSGECGKEDR